MPEFVQVFGLRRKLQFNQLFIVGIVGLWISYWLIYQWNVPVLIMNHISRDRAMAHENEMRLFRAANTCIAHFNTPETRPRPFDWALFEQMRQIKKYSVWWEPFYVNDKYKLLYCHNPQVASANIMRFMIKLSQPDHLQGNAANEQEIDATNVHGKLFSSPYLKSIQEYTREEAMRIFETYTKFTWVRNPLDRLLSAWRDKLTKFEEDFTYEFGSKIIRLYRPNATREEINTGYPVKFAEFLQYIAAFPFATRAFDIHWKPMYEICTMCAIKYDFIGKLENIDAEMNYFARQVVANASLSEGRGIKILTSLPKVAKSNSTFWNKEDFLRKLPRDLVKSALERQRWDYEFFGYDLQSDLERTGN